jgi:ABC-2 type transport system permease protein
VFFTVLLPLIFLFIFASIFGNDPIPGLPGVKVSTYYVPGIMTLAIVSATTVSLAIGLVEARESGVLKRLRGTPMPTWAFVAGRVGLLVSLAIGAAAFSCLGFALTTIIPTLQAAPAITNALVLPLYFLSGIFIPETEISDTVLNVAGVFPIRNLFEALFTAFDPTTTGAGFDWGHLAIVALWGLAGLAVAVRSFRWTPRD